jgi:hypothetical protein
MHKREVRFPITAVGATVAAIIRIAGFDEGEKQVFWLRSHSTCLALPQVVQWPPEAFVIRYSGATARDLHPIPYSPKTIVLGTLHLLHKTTSCAGIQRTSSILVQALSSSNRILKFRINCFYHFISRLSASKSDVLTLLGCRLCGDEQRGCTIR